MFKAVADADLAWTKGLEFAKWGTTVLFQKKRENGVQRLQKKVKNKEKGIEGERW